MRRSPDNDQSRFMGMEISPLTRRRIDSFRAHRIGYWSMWVFLVLFGITLFSEFIANDKPLLLEYKDKLYYPILKSYPETEFGGIFRSGSRLPRSLCGGIDSAGRMDDLAVDPLRSSDCGMGSVVTGTIITRLGALAGYG